MELIQQQQEQQQQQQQRRRWSFCFCCPSVCLPSCCHDPVQIRPTTTITTTATTHFHISHLRRFCRRLFREMLQSQQIYRACPTKT